jgi:hypothetical protein
MYHLAYKKLVASKYLLIYVVNSYALSSSDYITANDRMISK